MFKKLFAGIKDTISSSIDNSNRYSAAHNTAARNDGVIESMISAYLIGFDSYTISDPDLQNQINNYKSKLSSFANLISDPTKFYQQFGNSGLHAEYMALITAATMDGTALTNNADAVEADHIDSRPTIPTVSEFVEQYRVAYNTVKTAGYKKRGEVAYEKIFDVANRATDMLDAQLIFEKERLLWKIVTEDAMDIFSTIYEAMDPFYDFMRDPIALQIESYTSATCDEELTYLVERHDYKMRQIAAQAHIKISLATALGESLIMYCKKKQAVMEWRSDKEANSGVNTMVATRSTMRRTLAFAKTHFDLTFDDILNDKSMKLWLLDAKGVDGLNRIKVTLHPQNLDVMRDIVANEILSDITIIDAIKRQPPLQLWFDLDSDTYIENAKAKAATLNENVTYFKYLSAFEHTEAVKNIKKDMDTLTRPSKSRQL